MWLPFNRNYPERRAEDVHTHAYDYVVVGGMSRFMIAKCSTTYHSLLITS